MNDTVIYEIVKGLKHRDESVSFFGLCTHHTVQVGAHPIKIMVTRLSYDDEDFDSLPFVKVVLHDLRMYSIVMPQVFDNGRNQGVQWSPIKQVFVYAHGVRYAALSGMLAEVKYGLRFLEYSLEDFIKMILSNCVINRGGLDNVGFDRIRHFTHLANLVTGAELRSSC